MKLYHVAAMAKNRVIGKNNRLPWNFSSDLQHFKKLTLGSTVLMGRKTYESIGRPLPNRENFVLSRRVNTDGEHLRYFPDLESALGEVLTETCFIIGGGQLFQETINRVDGLYVTHIDADYEGDVFYPEIPSMFQEKTRTRLQDTPVLDVVFYSA